MIIEKLAPPPTIIGKTCFFKGLGHFNTIVDAPPLCYKIVAPIPSIMKNIRIGPRDTLV